MSDQLEITVMFIIGTFFIGLILFLALVDGPRHAQQAREDCVAENGRVIELDHQTFCLVDGSMVEVR